MCGRYTLLTDEEYQDIRKIIRTVQEKDHKMKIGEIYPPNQTSILVHEKGATVFQTIKRGVDEFPGSGVLINACSEIAEKKNL